MAWLCIHTRPKAEQEVQANLLDLALEVFFPTRRITIPDRARPGHSTVSTVPRYPRYLFADVDPTDYHAVPPVRGISQVVSTRTEDGDPVFLTVPLPVISTLMGTATPNLHAGQEIRLRQPYAGLRAIVQSIAHLDSTGQVQVWLDMLGARRTVTVHHSLVLTEGAPT